MKYSVIIAVCIMMVSLNTRASGEKLVSLDELQWKSRLILIFAREPDSSNATANLKEFKSEIDQRDIVWFVIDDKALQSNYDGDMGEKLHDQIIDSHFTPLPTANSVLLIGKDGTVKSRSSDLDLEATFGLIDQMPMRRAEMRRQGEDSG